LLPLAIWSAVSYVPFIWHPLVRIEQAAAWTTSSRHAVERAVFAQENAKVRAAHLREAVGERTNPVFLPAPHAVVRALYTAFRTPPRLPTEPWLHQSLWSSIQLIFWASCCRRSWACRSASCAARSPRRRS